MTSYIRTYKSHEGVSASLQKAAVDLSSRIPDNERLSLRQTPSGRAVAVSFKGYEKVTLANIYLDEIEQVAAIDHRRVEWTRARAQNLPLSLKSKKSNPQYFVTDKMAGERLRIKKEGKVVTVGKYMRRTTTEDFVTLVPPEHRRIPESIKNFVIHFIANIRKMICPKKRADQKLSAGSQGLISGIATWIVTSFGSTPAVAKALAASILIIVVTATRGAFCDMTVEMASSAIKSGY